MIPNTKMSSQVENLNLKTPNRVPKLS